MTGFEFKGFPLAQLETRILPKTDIRLCASRRRVAAGFRLALSAYRERLSESFSNPSNLTVETARLAGQTTRKIWSDGVRAWSAYFGVEAPQPVVQNTPQPKTLSLEFQPDENLKCGLVAILGCTACNGGLQPSPDNCPTDDAAVDTVYQQAQLGQRPPVREPTSE